MLTNIITEQTEALFANVRNCLMTCDMDYKFYDLSLWKHAYHMLHSLDRWFINPERYVEPAFHIDGLNSLDEPSAITLSRNELLAYFAEIETKIRAYLAGLTDEMLYEPPEGCSRPRFALILAQMRHLYAHLGNINATTILATGRWPRVKGLDENLSGELYE